MSTEKPLVFISYARQDRERILSYFDSLNNDDYSLWMDCKKLTAGQDWDFEIRKNFDKADIVVAFISKESYQKRGYIQRELKLALKNLEEKLRDDIYIIPVILDDVEIPTELKGIHCIKDLSEVEIISEIKKSINVQLDKITASDKKESEDKTISWRFENRKEYRDGLPGYEVDCQFIRLSSKDHKNIDDISLLINSDLVENFVEYRKVLLDQDSTLFNYGMSPYQRMDTIESNCTTVNVIGRIISILYSNYYMGAQAAHGNMGFSTYNFILDFPARINSLREIFKNPDQTLPKIQSHITEHLISTIYEGEADEHSLDWINNGIRDWEMFRNFTFNNDGITILFSPYSVAAYVYGPQIIQIPYSILYDDIKDLYISFLEIRRPM